jgi:acrylyl-CoA reductase (NADPH)/3-hydroxypropionyl-CoA dehydratase/3-hydroxypropionyl-CoA synthetase
VTAPDSHRLDVDADWWQPDVQTLPVGAPFRPGLDPIPAHQHAWAVVKDRWGLPAHGEPRDALRTVITTVPAIGPNDVLGYVLYAGLTYNTIFAARGVPISVFDLHDGDLHVPGSGAVVLVAAVGAEVARDGRIHVGELRVLVPGVSNLLSHVAGADPMFADFKIQGYETPDGTFAQFVRAQAPQLLAHSERLTLAEASSFMLDLQTVYKAIYDVARAVPGERVFVEGAAGGTGVYAVAGAVLRGCAVTGLVSSDARGELVRARGGRAYVDRTAPGIAGIFTAIPSDQAARAAWIAAGAPFVGAVRERNDGALMDIVVASTGRDVFPRSVELLAPGGRLVFFGATTGYTLTLLGKPGRASAADMLRRADLRPREGVMLYYGAGDADRVGDEAIDAAVAAGARVVAVASTDAQAAAARARPGIHGVVSVETLRRSAGLAWPEAMPDYDTDPDGFREYQDRTLKPLGREVGRLLATGDNPRGSPDVVIERAGADTLGISTFLARPYTGRIVYLEDTAGQRLSFYAPNVWMHQKRVLFPGFSILGSHLSNSHQASEALRLLADGALAVHPPAVHPWEALADVNQAIHENRHQGTSTVRVGAGPALDAARRARDVYASWGSRFVDGRSVRVRLDPVRPGFPDLVALVTIDSPPANAIGRSVLEDLERVLDALEREAALRACVVHGAGTMFVAGADIRELRAFGSAADVQAFCVRAQRAFARLGALRAPMISAVDGYALGGGNELQMASAYRVASRRAEIGQPEINLHVIPGFGGTQALPRLAVRHAAATGGQVYTSLVSALTVLLDGRRRTGEVAHALGLVDEVAPADALSHALAIARRIALGTFGGKLWAPLSRGGTIAFPNVGRDPEIQRLLEHHRKVPRSAAADAILDVVEIGLTRGIEAGLAAEAEAFGRLVASEEGRLGIDRFLERRSLPLPPRR